VLTFATGAVSVRFLGAEQQRLAIELWISGLDNA